MDGRTSGANGQPSWLGDGWDYSPGYIERSYRSCLDDGQPIQDLCYFSRWNATLVWGGKSTALVQDTEGGTGWHAADDSGLRVQQLYGASNYTVDGQYWRVTTQDGTQYYFGVGKRYASDPNNTLSTAVEPVFGDDSGDDCYQGTLATSWCNLGYRWHLDYVVDPRGNSMTYFYSKYTGAYGLNNGAVVAPYDMTVTLDRIEYGTRAGSEGSSSAPMKVQFGVSNRCISSGGTCTAWPDVPWDTYCSPAWTSCAQRSPTYWTSSKLDTITTKVWNAADGAYRDVDRWDMTYTFPSYDGVNSVLWLNNIQHTGLAGGSLAEPAMMFAGTALKNRVYTSEKMYRFRLSGIDNGLGGQQVINYEGSGCSQALLSTFNWRYNPYRCYPSWNGTGYDWYEKYTFSWIRDIDVATGAPELWSFYSYSNDGSVNQLWAYDTNEMVPPEHRNWSKYVGYATVTVKQGPDDAHSSKTKTLYYRGLHDDGFEADGTHYTVNVTDSQAVATTDARALAGMVREQTTLDGATPLASTITDYTVTQTAKRVTTIPSGTITAYRATTAASKQRTFLAASNTWRWSRTEYSYDSDGLLTQTKDLGETGTATGNIPATDDTCTTITYTTPDIAKWFKAYPAKTVTTDCSATPTDGSYLSGSQIFYDGSSTNGATPTAGLPTKTTVLQQVASGTQTWIQGGRAEYDTNGRVTKSYDGLDRDTTTTYTPAAGGPVTKVEIRNPLGHTTTSVLHPTLGAPTSVTDANGNITSAEYDPLGRTRKLFQPHNSTVVNYTATTATQTFTDITDTGTQVPLTGDDTHTQISLPFAFSFYGQTYSSAYLSSNGLLSFTGQSADSESTTLPDPNLPNAAIYPFWDDLQLIGQSEVATQVTGTAPNRQFTIEWYQAYLFNRGTRVTFSITLHENGNIVFNYTGIDANGHDQGNAATIGIENQTGSAATQYAYHQTLIATNKAITFTPSVAAAITLPDVEYAYTFGSSTAPSVVTTKAVTAKNTQVARYDIYDGLMRPRQTQVPSLAAAGGRVIADTQYDGRGLAVKTSSFYNSAAPSGTLAAFADTGVTKQVRTTYDLLNRPTVSARWSQNSLLWQSTVSYDGDRVTTTPADGAAAVTVFDVSGSTTSLKLYPTSTVTGTPEITSYTYDRLGQLTKVVDASTGNQITNNYDLLGRRTSSTDPDTGSSSTKYDAGGQVTWTVDGRNQKISYEYDQLGRETTRWAGEITTGTKLATYTYDTLAKGMPTSSTRWVGADQYTLSVDGYTERYQPTGQTWKIPMIQGALAGTKQLSYSYDPIGNLTSVAYPAGGGLPAESVTYSYNDLNAPTTTIGLSSYVTSATYGEFGELKQRVQGASGASQLTRQYFYDPATMRLTSVQSLLPNQAQPGQFTTVQNDGYAYTATGDITRITDGTDSQSQCYKYDGQHRLTDAWTAADACLAAPAASAVTSSGKYPYWDTYTFDTSGRRTTDTHRISASNTTNRIFHYPAVGAARVHGATSVDYSGAAVRTDSMTYDNAGNTQQRTINGVVTDFTYNSENQFAAATVHAAGGDQTTTHLYDAGGGLLIRKEPGGTTLYAAGQEYKLTGASTVTATRQYSHGGASVAVRTNDGVSWLAADHQGSANLTVNSTTGTVQRRWYTPYGADRATQGAWPNDRGFLNKQNNASTGLLDVGAREYDPNLGTFLSPDPVLSTGDPVTYNAYAYSAHSPIVYSDPSGLIHSGAESGGVMMGSAPGVGNVGATRQESGGSGASGGSASGTLTIPGWDGFWLFVAAAIVTTTNFQVRSTTSSAIYWKAGASTQSATTNDVDAARSQRLGNEQVEQLDELKGSKARNYEYQFELDLGLPEPAPAGGGKKGGGGGGKPPRKPPVFRTANPEDDPWEDLARIRSNAGAGTTKGADDNFAFGRLDIEGRGTTYGKNGQFARPWPRPEGKGGVNEITWFQHAEGMAGAEARSLGYTGGVGRWFVDVPLCGPCAGNGLGGIVNLLDLDILYVRTAQGFEGYILRGGTKVIPGEPPAGLF
ncbi:RHS repeat-associated core domain-containing protein [Dactylosporangium siamense]|uniref:RHS repeat-associated core domain-containing protein n=1 Tax=Dactylosporangium siamense TaxID=685454 RepID=UPI00360D0AEF